MTTNMRIEANFERPKEASTHCLLWGSYRGRSKYKPSLGAIPMLIFTGKNDFVKSSFDDSPLTRSTVAATSRRKEGTTAQRKGVVSDKGAWLELPRPFRKVASLYGDANISVVEPKLVQVQGIHKKHRRQPDIGCRRR